MTTKPASKVKEAPPTALEKIAYGSVSAIPTVEPNDRNRLGYHVWRWIKNREGSLDHAISESGSRLSIPRQEALKIITEALKKQGIE